MKNEQMKPVLHIVSREASPGARGFMASLFPYRYQHGGSKAVSELGRCAVVNNPMTQVGLHKYVVGFLPERAPKKTVQACYFVAALWGYFDIGDMSGMDLGKAAAHVLSERARKRRGDGGFERKFASLLEAKRDVLMIHLREILGDVAKEGSRIDWSLLIDDLAAWDHPALVTQNRWATSFWKKLAKNKEQDIEYHDAALADV